ncbi:MAG: hypothetical protein ABIJ61_12720, partial [bacterium]
MSLSEKKPHIGLLMLIIAAVVGVLICGCSNSEPEPETENQPAIEAESAELPSLQEQLDAKKAEFVAKVPAEVAGIVDDGVAQVAASGV